MSAVERTLRRARALIATRETWCQGALARKKRMPGKGWGIAYCALGAIEKVKTSRDSAYGAQAALQVATHRTDIGTFNDTSTHAEVLAAFDKTIRAVAKASRP